MSDANEQQMFQACAKVIRDIMSGARRGYPRPQCEKTMCAKCTISLEFLMGRSLEKNAFNLGVLPQLKEAIDELGFKAADLFELEPDAGLGNGGLGRLAACYLDSMTTLEIPATGYPSAMNWASSNRRSLTASRSSWPIPGKSWGTPGSSLTPAEAETVRFGGKVTPTGNMAAASWIRAASPPCWLSPMT